jgi:hypothetical protein
MLEILEIGSERWETANRSSNDQGHHFWVPESVSAGTSFLM